MKPLVQVVVVTAYFLAVGLLTFGVWYVLAAPFAEQRSDPGATISVALLVACIAAGGYFGLRGFGWVQKRVL